MLPLLLSEFTWKTVWLLDYGSPDWSWDQLSPTFSGDFQAIAFGVILMPIVIPLIETAAQGDFVGHRWCFSQSITDVDPRDWVGTPGLL